MQRYYKCREKKPICFENKMKIKVKMKDQKNAQVYFPKTRKALSPKAQNTACGKFADSYHILKRTSLVLDSCGTQYFHSSP